MADEAGVVEVPGTPDQAGGAEGRVADEAGVAQVPGTPDQADGAEAGRSGDDGVPLERSLPGRSYTSEAEFARERDQVLLPGWFCVGRADSLTEPGCYLAADVCGESVIVTRTEDGGLAGYYNLCRHRGSRLVPRPIGCEPAAARLRAPSPSPPRLQAPSPSPPRLRAPSLRQARLRANR